MSAAEAEAVSELLPQVARFMAREVRGDVIDREGLIPESVRAGAGRLGLFGMTIPEEWGGSGLTLASACRVVAEIARFDRSTAIMIGLHAGLGIRGLVEHGSDELRKAWLPRLASGECIASFCATEAGAGSDLTAIRTTGESDPGGLRIDGEKVYVTNGGFSSTFTALIRTPGLGGARAHSLVLIPAKTPGVHVGREEHKLGIRGSSTVTVRFERVVVPMQNVLGTPGGGMDLAHGLLTWGRTLMSAGCVGSARAALLAAVDYSRTRRQFGRTIGEFGATRAHLAWMASRTYAMEAFVQHVAEMHARGESIEIDSAIAKVFSSESAFTIADRALQLHGGMGFIEETGVARILRDTRITRIFEGANDVLLVRLGAARITAGGEAFAPIPPFAGADAADATDASASVASLYAAVEGAVLEAKKKFGLGVVRRQLVLQRIAGAELASRVARVVLARSAREGVPEASRTLAIHAAMELVEEGQRSLAALAHEARDDEYSAKITASLYEAKT